MAPQMIESIAVAQLTEHRASVERLRLRKQARAESRLVRRQAASAENPDLALSEFAQPRRRDFRHDVVGEGAHP